MTVKNFKHIACLIKANRKKVGLSQEELSHNLGYKNGQFISNVERELCTVPAKKLNILSEKLDVSKDIIIDCMARDYTERLYAGAN